MDIQTAGLVGLAVVSLVVIFALLRFRQKARFEIKGPGGIGATFEGEDRQSGPSGSVPSSPSSPSSSGIVMEGIKSRRGSVQAEDHPGHGVSMKDIDAHGDVKAVSGDPGPKG